MSVILNEHAIERLLDSELGPVGRHVRVLAEDVRNQARQNVSDIMSNSVIDPSGAIDFQMIGSTAIVGIRDEGKVTRYLDEKAAAEKEVGGLGDWMRNALRVVFPG